MFLLAEQSLNLHCSAAAVAAAASSPAAVSAGEGDSRDESSGAEQGRRR